MCWRSFCTFGRPLCVSVRQSFFVSDFVCRLICLKVVNNEIFLITHLSADNLSGLNFLSVSHLCFFCHRILRSHALKIKISKNRHGADTNAYKYLLLGSLPVVILSMRPVCKIVFFQTHIFSSCISGKMCHFICQNSQ